MSRVAACISPVSCSKVIGACGDERKTQRRMTQLGRMILTTPAPPNDIMSLNDFIQSKFKKKKILRLSFLMHNIRPNPKFVISLYPTYQAEAC